MEPGLIQPDWQVTRQVRALQTTRNGGVSQGPYAGFNLGDNTSDVPQAVLANKALLRRYLPDEPVWLRQVHGTAVMRLPLEKVTEPVADAVFTCERNVVCAVRTADCLPVYLADRLGSVVGVAHAGWRGLAAGVIEAAVAGMRNAQPQADLVAWLGPAIGPQVFEVGDEVRAAFVAHDAAAASAFHPRSTGKWLADLYQLARLRLRQAGVTDASGGGFCTYSEEQRFYSYRRNPVTGRMASCIWIEEQ